MVDEKTQLARRRQLRKCATPPEQLLWGVLRNRQFHGLKFRRQFSIGPWIVDFACPEQKLVIEIDGGYHDYVDEQDLQRQQWLERQGYQVFKFDNDDVMEDVAAILVALEKKLGLLEGHSVGEQLPPDPLPTVERELSAPHPDPLPTGKREEDSFDPSQPLISGIDTLIIGCGNLLRGDDATGPVLIRRLWERGLPRGVHCADGGTGGMDVAFQMRRVPHVILVDACQSGSKPGTLFEVPGDEVEQLPPVDGINLHSFRWDHAIAFGRWLLKDDYPDKITVYLVEGASFDMGQALSPVVDSAIDRLADKIFEVINDKL